MATLEYPFLIYWSFLLVSYLYSSESSHALNTSKVQYTEHKCNTNTSLSPDSVCRPAGHDSTSNRTTDQVDKTSYETKLINEAAVTTTLTLPVTFGVGKPSDTDKYAVVFGLGSPKQQLSLLFNTFTNLMWTRCTDKTLEAVRLTLYFNSNASSSYRTVPCESCNIYNLPPKKRGCLDRTCVYNGPYDDYQSSVPSSGLLSFDRLNLTDHEVSDFIFVCVPYDPPPDSIRSDAGLLGLGRGDLSFISQVGPMYNNYFHYCLPSSSRYQGYLTFGKNKDNNNNDLKFTPSFIRADYPSYYFINIISISVGSIELKMDYSKVFLNRGIAVDPGVSITRLPAEAYAALRDEFRNQTGGSHMMWVPRGILDTCYDTSSSSIKSPTISFTFEDEVKVDFNGPQIFEDYRFTTVKCLAFSNNTNPPSVSILGNTQQKTMEVGYDDLDAAGGGRLGFRPNACK
ncbi:hypothetical protein OROMI_031314 [Orobanche minor]